MVMITQTSASTDLASSRRLLTSRLSQLEASAATAASAAGTRSSRQKSVLHVPAVRRLDQRSTISIVGSGGGVSSHSSGSRSLQLRSVGGDTSLRFIAIHHPAEAGARRPPRPRQHLQLGKPGSHTSGIKHYQRGANSGASNSAGREASPAASATRIEDDVLGRMSSTTTQRLGKTVSISASQERTPSTRLGQSGDASRRSIIKLKPLPAVGQMRGVLNDEFQAKEARLDSVGMRPHQLREQKILNECRFVPIDSFYKKVIVAPNQDRQFFAAPKCIREQGSRQFYDIANQNPRHHQDVNFDFVRGSIKLECPNFCLPSQFRHFY